MRGALDGLYDDYNREDSASDPVHRVRPFAQPADREIAGFCAAALAFGRVASVLNSIDALFALIGPRPAEFVRGVRARTTRPPACARMVHRWIRGDDLVALLWILRQMLEQSGSIERFFLEGYRAERRGRRRGARQLFDPRAGARRPARLRPACRGARACAISSRGRPPGSACKRLNLFLRWMVRRDEVDLGVWTQRAAVAS